MLTVTPAGHPIAPSCQTGSTFDYLAVLVAIQRFRIFEFFKKIGGNRTFAAGALTDDTKKRRGHSLQQPMIKVELGGHRNDST